MREVNEKGKAEMEKVRNFLARSAEFRIGERVTFRSGTYHVADGAEVEVVKVDLNHSHPGGHRAECFAQANIAYDVKTLGEGKNWIRFTARPRELHRR